MYSQSIANNLQLSPAILLKNLSEMSIGLEPARAIAPSLETRLFYRTLAPVPPPTLPI